MFTIGKFAAAGNVGVETIRFYQRKGLLHLPVQDKGFRRYGDEDLRRLRFIRNAQTAGFTLEEIRDLLSLNTTDERTRIQELAAARIATLDEKIQKLQQVRGFLKQLTAQCHKENTESCPIVDAFDK